MDVDLDAARGAVTMVDRRRGAKAGPEPLRTLAAYRRADGGGVAFGAEFSVVRPGALAVGDGFRVTGRSREAVQARSGA
ncbi:hypothetical protein [Actinomadura sp. 21ATH]|uniref:hypothetical protein n=1 Tax=Actinomadura sp. 21ATH TaxID=1735444 RepID=UPI0035C112AA